jgi:hypothetical protein
MTHDRRIERHYTASTNDHIWALQVYQLDKNCDRTIAHDPGGAGSLPGFTQQIKLMVCKWFVTRQENGLYHKAKQRERNRKS